MEQEYETIDLREIFSLLKKNLLLIFLVTMAFAIAGFTVTALLITPQYEASATMIVNSREDQQAQTTVTNDQINSAKQLVNTYAVILKSDTVLGKTIEDLGLNLKYEVLAEKVSIEAVDSTQIMKITVRDPNPELARNIVNSIVEQGAGDHHLHRKSGQCGGHLLPQGRRKTGLAQQDEKYCSGGPCRRCVGGGRGLFAQHVQQYLYDRRRCHKASGRHGVGCHPEY